MTDPADLDKQNERRPGGDLSVGRLLRSAGARPAPTPEIEERVRAAVHREYLEALMRQRRRRWSLAAAASVALLVAGAFFFRQLQPDPVAMARVTRTVGTAASLDSADTASGRIVDGQLVRVGETVSVPPNGRVSLELTNGIGLRVNESSVVAFEAPQRLRLERGEVYVETPRRYPDAADVTVVTAHGSVRHVGTRFEVHSADDGLRVRVRDGAAVFRSLSGASTTVPTGMQLDYREGRAATLLPGPGAVSDEWAWAESVGPEFRVEGRSLLEALDWFAHEAGLHLEFTDDKARSRAAVVILHGTVSGLTPRQAVDAIMVGTDLRYAIENTRLLIG